MKKHIIYAIMQGRGGEAGSGVGRLMEENGANAYVTALKVLLAFIFGTLFLGLALRIILGGIYEWSWKPVVHFFSFSETY